MYLHFGYIERTHRYRIEMEKRERNMATGAAISAIRFIGGIILFFIFIFKFYLRDRLGHVHKIINKETKYSII